MRKLVTVRQISELNPIEGADAIEVATVDGWKVVVKKGEYEVGQYVVYFEIDSILPEGRPEFEFLMARGCKDQPTETPGVFVRGHRLRTIKLRGQISQGLVIRIPTEFIDQMMGSALRARVDGTEAEDFSELFGVMKYERPIPTCLAGKVRGSFPGWFPKTDQERIQNCFNEIPRAVYQIEEKIEGSSITVYWDGEKAGVTSRSLDLSLDQEGNSFVDTARRSGLLAAVERLGQYNATGDVRVAVRGELIGPAIQNNIYRLNDFKIVIYDIWFQDKYVSPATRLVTLDFLLRNHCDQNMVIAVPVVGTELIDTSAVTMDELIARADGKSVLGDTLREGLVFKGVNYETGRVYSFKAISNQYLLKEKD